MPITIRPVTPADYEQWLPLWAGYNAFYQRVGPAAVPLEMTNLTWQRFFDGYEPLHALVAEQDGKLVGLVHYIYHRNTTMVWPVRDLQGLFTAPQTRGKGIGQVLIEGGSRRAKPARSPRVYCH